MKFKLVLLVAFILGISSCKNESKEDNLKSNPNASRPKTEKKTSLEDSLKNDSAAVDSSKSNLAEDRKLLANFFIKNDKKPQFFLINNQKDTTIVCAEKTKITIKANSFVSLKTGNEAIGKIKISVKEYYSISDMILGGLSTTSNGKLLETGGMLYISATANGEKCDLKKETNIEIAFPQKIARDKMQLFNGNWKKDQINWTVDKNSVNLNQTFTQVDEKPEFPGGNQKMYKFIGNNFRTPEDGSSGKIYASFIIDKEGNVTKIRIIKGFSKETNEETIRVLKLLPKFSPGKIKGIAVKTAYMLPITIRGASEDGGSLISKPYVPNYTEKTLLEAGASEIGEYLFNATKLGFINCDRFIDYPDDQKIDYVLDIKDDSDVSVYLIFHSFKSIIKGLPNSDQMLFKNVLSKEKITLVAIKYFNEKPFLAIEETTTNTKLKNGLTFHPVTLEEIKNETKKLNKLN